MFVMMEFDYAASAELFTRSGVKARLRYRRFPRAAEAIQHAVEQLSPRDLLVATLTVEGESYNGREIRALYEDVGYPLNRTPPQ